MTDVSIDYAVLGESAILLLAAASALTGMGARTVVREAAVPTDEVRSPLETVGAEQAARSSASADVLLGAVRLIQRAIERYQRLDRTAGVVP